VACSPDAGNRVRLAPEGIYINASYVVFPDAREPFFIASQAPLEETEIDFWRMVYEHRVSTIVMLCRFDCSPKDRPQSIHYLPPLGKLKSLSFLGVALTKEEELMPGLKERTVEISAKGLPPHQVTHLHYEGWPDHGVFPEKDYPLINRLLHALTT
jgi:protein tyrosine phosphatase